MVLLISAVFLWSPPRTAYATSESITVNQQDQTGRQWVGLGTEWSAYDNGTINRCNFNCTDQPYAWTGGQWTTTTTRLNYMRMPISSSYVIPEWFCNYLSACQSNPGPTTYNWSSPMMSELYNHLAYALNNNIDLELGMWNFWNPSRVAWSWQTYANVAGDLLVKLRQLGYTNIRYFVVTFEPDLWSISLSTWITIANDLATTFAADGLTPYVRIIGPNTCCGLGDSATWVSDGGASYNEGSNLGAYDWHFYATDYYLGECFDQNGNGYPCGKGDAYLRSGYMEGAVNRQLSGLVGYDGNDKPLIMSEMGNNEASLNAVSTSPGDQALDDADYGIQLARSGQSGGMLWCTDDTEHGSNCGLFDVSAGSLGDWSRPSYFTWSLLTRYLPRGATMFASPASPQSNTFRFVAARIPSADQAQWTFALINRDTAPAATTIQVPGALSATFDEYVYTNGVAPLVDGNGLPVATTSFTATPGYGMTVTVPANSFVLLTSMNHPSAAGQPNIVSVSDDLSDINKFNAQTGNLTFDHSSPSYFGNDLSRLTRTDTNPGTVVWKTAGIGGFAAHVYYYTAMTTPTFAVSQDGVNWTSIASNSTPPNNDTNGWYDTTLTASTPIPGNMRYLSITITGGVSWAVQLARMEIYSRGIVDNLADGSQLNNGTAFAGLPAGWQVDRTYPAYFEWHGTRAERTLNATEQLIWHMPNAGDFAALIYFVGSIDGGQVSFSSSGSSSGPWNAIAASHDTPVAVPGGQGWTRTWFTPNSQLSGNDSYLMITIGNNASIYSPQLARMVLVHAYAS